MTCDMYDICLQYFCFRFLDAENLCKLLQHHHHTIQCDVLRMEDNST